jgi:hypothetical protein
MKIETGVVTIAFYDDALASVLHVSKPSVPISFMTMKSKRNISVRLVVLVLG